jgi:hypothetical protein
MGPFRFGRNLRYPHCTPDRDRGLVQWCCRLRDQRLADPRFGVVTKVPPSVCFGELGTLITRGVFPSDVLLSELTTHLSVVVSVPQRVVCNVGIAHIAFSCASRHINI